MDHGKYKSHKRKLGNWYNGILPLESSSGWIRRTERCLWRGCGDRLSSSRSLVFNPLSENTFQGMFWCYPGSQRRLCDSRDESIYKTDSILSILLTFFSSANKHVLSSWRSRIDVWPTGSFTWIVLLSLLISFQLAFNSQLKVHTTRLSGEHRKRVSPQATWEQWTAAGNSTGPIYSSAIAGA